MSNLGMGAMLHYLGGGNKNPPCKYYGLRIMKAIIDDNKLMLTFNNDLTIEIWDNGQSCCERRYMSTDDELSTLIGERLTIIETKEGSTIDKDYDTHEQVFVEIGTEKGFITIVNHNEHNGYYGGFGLTITEKKHD